ncbi:MAG: TIR domain-containing protein [Erythrobacter sp.]
MYNLFVSGNSESWDGEPWVIEKNRCVTVGEYTDENLAQMLGALDQAAIGQICELPSIFAYESSCQKNPKFGRVRDIAVRNQQVRIEYDLVALPHFLTWEQMLEFEFALGVGGWEMNRTHWAVKNIDLIAELARPQIGLALPANPEIRVIDIEERQFDVGLSFAGEYRGDVAQIAARLTNNLGVHKCFYDMQYQAQLARPNLDNLLKKIYRDQCALLVVFFGQEYQDKDWCGIEWRSIREIINHRQDRRVMFVKMSDGQVDGMGQFDGYVPRDRHTPDEIADMILERCRALVA